MQFTICSLRVLYVLFGYSHIFINLKSLESVVNVELLNVCDWLRANKLSLNIKETNLKCMMSITKACYLTFLLSLDPLKMLIIITHDLLPLVTSI